MPTPPFDDELMVLDSRGASSFFVDHRVVIEQTQGDLGSQDLF